MCNGAYKSGYHYKYPLDFHVPKYLVECLILMNIYIYMRCMYLVAVNPDYKQIRRLVIWDLVMSWMIFLGPHMETPYNKMYSIVLSTNCTINVFCIPIAFYYFPVNAYDFGH